MFNTLIFNKNKAKYLSVLLFQLIISGISILMINSFFNEEHGMPIIILFFILQSLNIIYFIIFKLIYFREIFLLENDGISIFLTKGAFKKNVLFNKILQFAIFIFYQYIFYALFIIIIKLNIEKLKIVVFNILLTTMILFSFFMTTVALANKIRKNYFESLAAKILMCSIIIILYLPSYYFIYIAMIALFIGSIYDLYLIIRRINHND